MQVKIIARIQDNRRYSIEVLIKDHDSLVNESLDSKAVAHRLSLN